MAYSKRYLRDLAAFNKPQPLTQSQRDSNDRWNSVAEQVLHEITERWGAITAENARDVFEYQRQRTVELLEQKR